jgi:hypothetical protein
MRGPSGFVWGWSASAPGYHRRNFAKSRGSASLFVTHFNNVATKTESSKEQIREDRLIEAARELGCDEDESAFMEKLGQGTRVKTKDEPKKPRVQKDHRKGQSP